MLHYFFHVVFLKEADGGDAGGSGFEAGAGIRQRNAAERED